MGVALIRMVGGQRLEGAVRAGGRKNSAVAVLPAALLGRAPVELDNIPGIADVGAMMALLRGVGAEIETVGPGRLRVSGRNLHPAPVDAALANRLRASYYLLGVEMARFGEADVPLPGGCDIGLRPIDQHLKGLAAMGAEVELVHGRIRARAARLRGAHIYLDVTSVGATINLMVAACGASGTTVIENAAKEPHVVDVASLLLAMGAAITGAGTDVIKVRGGEPLGGAVHAIIPDEIEAATFMIAAAGTQGTVRVDNVIPRHLEPVTAKLREAGVDVAEGPDSVEVRAVHRCRAVNIKTLPYPGFPTDAQQLMTALLSVAEGTSTVTETIWDGRFRFVDELLRMGARIRVEGRTAVVEGVPQLSGAPVRGADLRGAAALILAGLFAAGETEVNPGPYLDRGYEDLPGKLGRLGARVWREPGGEGDGGAVFGGVAPAGVRPSPTTATR
jgi:UDP-N-acetylglucosamine 1-carboxyvinyltransferase